MNRENILKMIREFTSKEGIFAEDVKDKFMRVFDKVKIIEDTELDFVIKLTENLIDIGAVIIKPQREEFLISFKHFIIRVNKTESLVEDYDSRYREHFMGTDNLYDALVRKYLEQENKKERYEGELKWD